jgi:hypothetical protein
MLDQEHPLSQMAKYNIIRAGFHTFCQEPFHVDALSRFSLYLH